MADDDVTITIRCPRDVKERIDALVPVLGARDELRAIGKVTQAATIRLALLRGVEALEAEDRPGKGKRRR